MEWHGPKHDPSHYPLQDPISSGKQLQCIVTPQKLVGQTSCRPASPNDKSVLVNTFVCVNTGSPSDKILDKVSMESVKANKVQNRRGKPAW